MVQGALQRGASKHDSVGAWAKRLYFASRGVMDTVLRPYGLGSTQTFAMYAGPVICLVGLIFAGVTFMSGNIQRGVIGLFGAIFGAGV